MSGIFIREKSCTSIKRTFLCSESHQPRLDLKQESCVKMCRSDIGDVMGAASD